MAIVLALVAAPLTLTLALTPAPAAAAESGSTVISSGPALTWGLKQSWRNYVPAPAVTGGAAVVAEDWGVIGEGYNLTWPLESGSYDATTGTTVLAYAGTVHWTKYRAVSEMHGTQPPEYTGTDPDPYTLDVTFSSPRLTIGPEGSTLSVSAQVRNQQTWNMVDHGRIVLATLDISGIDPTVSAGDEPVTTWPTMKTTATAALAGAVPYTAGTVMDGVHLSYDGPGGAPVTVETFAVPGVDVLKATAATQISSDGIATTPTFWWVDQEHNLAHYSYPAGAGTTYQAVDLTTGANVGTPLELPSADSVIPVFWDTTRNRIVYRPLSSNGSGAPADRWLRYDTAEGTYVTGTLAVSGFTAAGAAAYDEVRDRAYQISQVKPDGVATGDYDHYEMRVQTWDFSAEGSELTESRSYLLPHLAPGFNGAAPYAGFQSGVGTSASASYRTSAVLADGSLLVLGARRQYVDPGSGASSYPAMEIPGLVRLVLDDTESTATPHPVSGTEFANATSSSQYVQMVIGPEGRVALVNNSKAVVQTVALSGTGVASDLSPRVTLPYGAGEIPTAFVASMDHSDGTLWFGTRQSQRLIAVRGGKVVSAGTYPERSSRGGLVVAGPDHAVYSLSTDGLTIGMAAFYSISRFDLVGTTAVITEQPEDGAATVGADQGGDESATATFSAAGTGRPSLTYQWQIKQPGADRFTNLPGQTGTTATVSATRELSGVSRVRAIVTTAAGRVSTEVVDLTVRSAPEVSQAPVDITALEAGVATFSVASTGFPEPAVTWQRRVSGYWENVGADDPEVVISGAELSLRNLNTDQSGSRFRAKLTNSVGTTYSPTAVLTVNPTIPAGGLNLSGVSLEWEVSEEVQALPYAGGSNYLSAGDSAGDQASYQASAGDVSVYQVSSTGQRTVATYGTRAAHLANDGRQVVQVANGTARLGADGAGKIAWDGAFSANFYGGLVPFTVTDPELEIAADGTGVMTADLSGYGSSQENPDDKVKLDPAADVVIATFTGLELDPAGVLTATPDYAGVEATVPPGEAPQNRSTAGWGAWPQSWVDYQFKTGLSSYWYSSGGQADTKKPALPVKLDFTAAHQIDGSGPPRITTQPTSVAVQARSEAVFTVVASGDGVSYQWSKRVGSVWVSLVEETAATLRLASTEPEDAGRYRVRVANQAGAVVSQEVTLRIAARPSSLTLRAPARLVYGQGGTVVVRVPDRSGTVTLSGAGAPLRATLAQGQATFILPGRLGAGAHTLRATYAGNATYASAAATAQVRVRRVGVSFVALRAVGRVTATKRGKVALKLGSATGAVPGGKVTVTVRKGSTVRRVRVSLHGGTATVRLPLMSPGRWKVTALYAQSANFARASRSITIKVRR